MPIKTVTAYQTSVGDIYHTPEEARDAERAHVTLKVLNEWIGRNLDSVDRDVGIEEIDDPDALLALLRQLHYEDSGVFRDLVTLVDPDLLADA